jgi:hypothetical protein
MTAAKLKATREENESILLQNEADAAELASLKEQVDSFLSVYLSFLSPQKLGRSR